MNTAKDRIKNILEKLEKTMIDQDLERVSEMMESDAVFMNRDQKTGALFMIRKVVSLLEGEETAVERAIREIEEWNQKVKGALRISEEDYKRACYILEEEERIPHAVDRIERRGIIYALDNMISRLKKHLGRE